MSHRRVQKEKKATNYYVRFGHSLWSANQLPAQEVNAASNILLIVENKIRLKQIYKNQSLGRNIRVVELCVEEVPRTREVFISRCK